MGHAEKVMSDAVAQAADREGKYLTFSLAGEEYGIGILKIREIIGMMPITSVPETPALCQRGDQPAGQGDPGDGPAAALRHSGDRLHRAHLHHRGGDGKPRRHAAIGIVVDAVSEVLNIKGGDIEDTRLSGPSSTPDYILGMAKMGKGVKLLLDIDRVLSTERWKLLIKQLRPNLAVDETHLLHLTDQTKGNGKNSTRQWTSERS